MKAFRSVFYCSMAILLLMCLTSGKPILNPKDFVKFSTGIYVSKHEVTNEEYRQFLTWCKTSTPSQYASLLYDSAQWTQKFNFSYNEPLRFLYHWHPAYNRYPVVNITQADAEAYCKWLTEAYNADPARKYKKVLFRLPREEEWLSFALPAITPTSPADDLANIKWKDEGKGIDDYKIDGALHTAPVIQFKANHLGLFDILGNVSELTSNGHEKGGNWDSYASDCEASKTQDYTLPDPRVGFRVVMEVQED